MAHGRNHWTKHFIQKWNSCKNLNDLIGRFYSIFVPKVFNLTYGRKTLQPCIYDLGWLAFATFSNLQVSIRMAIMGFSTPQEADGTWKLLEPWHDCQGVHSTWLFQISLIFSWFLRLRIMNSWKCYRKPVLPTTVDYIYMYDTFIFIMQV